MMDILSGKAEITVMNTLGKSNLVKFSLIALVIVVFTSPSQAQEVVPPPPPPPRPEPSTPVPCEKLLDAANQREAHLKEELRKTRAELHQKLWETRKRYTVESFKQACKNAATPDKPYEYMEGVLRNYLLQENTNGCYNFALNEKPCPVDDSNLESALFLRFHNIDAAAVGFSGDTWKLKRISSTFRQGVSYSICAFSQKTHDKITIQVHSDINIIEVD
ncbi:hypothetical protein [Aquimarina macrocephali]|uniref:hypothetical protein n=1 Tax=Aquimarina macrocephali TaxID=666563 RepID=UPI0004B6266F|nr:hypothetical protein [Aquimarina macrocephali]